MNDVPGYRIERADGEVFGLTVRARNIGRPPAGCGPGGRPTTMSAEEAGLPRNVHDIEWLGLELTGDGLRATLQVQRRHISPAGRLYGGVAVGAAVTVMEEVTGRAAAWVTVQFASSCGLGDVLDLRVAVSAAGRRTAQLRVVATVGDTEVFVALGAVRVPPDEAGGGTGAPSGARAAPSQWLGMPAVAPPEDCTPLVWEPPFDAGHLAHSEMRLAVGAEPDTARMAMWCRPIGSGRLSAAVLGWQADLLGLAVVAPTGATGATSLDNTVRFGPGADPVEEWVLADIRGHLATGGLAHGSVDLWSRHGVLLATASQSCLLRDLPPAP
jgi:acyl-CoA thioesterase